ncbi:hypothetical protein GWO69_00770 [Corynebacterium macginleyi]|uniref:hypothetical protein n=1 Tax=Corynebacterium macginleyi TaxID=38290 RepID=UPI00190ABAEE|nr:hypothetical protein [Corynebacterium macginleyi]MBK4156054.1 hypothetical protein [Corynebacterium macginleyi]
MRFARMAIGGALAVAATVGMTGVASAYDEGDHPFFEEHRFTGSPTSAAAFHEWFAGGEFVRPTVETRDITELKVNDFETARAGDVVYKNDSGEFWIKKHATIK